MTTHEQALTAFYEQVEVTSVGSIRNLDAGIAAYLSALLPEDAAGLVERLRAFAAGCRGSMWQSRDETIRLCDDAASLIQSQAAREQALMDALERVTELLVDTWRVLMPSSNDPEKDIAVITDRALLKVKHKG